MLLPLTPQEAAVLFRQRRFPFDHADTFGLLQNTAEIIGDALRRTAFALETECSLFPEYVAALADPSKAVQAPRDMVYAVMCYTTSACQNNLVSTVAIGAYKVAHDKVTTQHFCRALIEVVNNCCVLLTQARYAMQGMATEYEATTDEHQRLAELAQFLGNMTQLLSEQTLLLQPGMEGATPPV